MSLTKKLNPKFTGLGKKFHGVVDPDQADASQAIAVGFQQIKEIFNITPQQLATVSQTLETTKGLIAQQGFSFFATLETFSNNSLAGLNFLDLANSCLKT